MFNLAFDPQSPRSVRRSAESRTQAEQSSQCEFEFESLHYFSRMLKSMVNVSLNCSCSTETV